MRVERKDLLGIENLTRNEIEIILDTAETMKEISERAIRKVPYLRGKTVVNLFFEPSTRTLASFALAEKRLSADSFNLSGSSSSALKGETLLDTVRNLEAMKIDFVVIRHAMSGAAYFIAERLEASVINAGDGTHEHPTQALLDLLSLKERLGNIKDKKVLIVGDILHSRVARSNIWAFKKMGAKVSLCGPPTLMPYKIENMGVEVSYNLDEAIQDMDVIYVLRIQKERQRGGLLPSLREYIELYGITLERFENAKDDVVIMHPGPINRGIEIDPRVADGTNSIILDQVTNGVAVRMAILYLLSGGKSGEVSEA
ncbi:MAG: aspartate carbamoyltransferase catalytic subunit [Candidatus Cloacimonadota bacterium]|nr:MAG: aspartate carbamoyltransferase catalytic subunit [Candidatus Cloacimonadota bacterium]